MLNIMRWPGPAHCGGRSWIIEDWGIGHLKHVQPKLQRSAFCYREVAGHVCVEVKLCGARIDVLACVSIAHAGGLRESSRVEPVHSDTDAFGFVERGDLIRYHRVTG